MLILKEKIKSEIDPLWSIEIKWQNVNVCKDFDEEVMLEANMSIYVKLQQYAPIFVCLAIGDLYNEKNISLSFGDNTCNDACH